MAVLKWHDIEGLACRKWSWLTSGSSRADDDWPAAPDDVPAASALALSFSFSNFSYEFTKSTPHSQLISILKSLLTYIHY